MNKYIETEEYDFVERDKWGKDQDDILDELLKEQGITEYAIEGGSDEGGQLPTKLETCSWIILLSNERILGFWLDWDPKRIAPDGSKGYYRLKRSEGPAEGRLAKGWWLKSPSYIYARTKLGLPITEKQEKILKEDQERFPGHYKAISKRK